mmetsp:Transcript_7184/g.9856  ORF Transcript_7184/g.9856 Transcript_7184/m.9856 type:complete len:119 (-) Transcript_7184:72-428(-)
MNTRGAMEDAPSSSMKSLSISTRGGKGGNKVIRQAVVNGVRIELERGNIVDCRVEALVNAANTLSFTRMDCGVRTSLFPHHHVCHHWVMMLPARGKSSVHISQTPLTNPCSCLYPLGH